MDWSIITEFIAGNWQIATITIVAYLVGIVLKSIPDEKISEAGDKIGAKAGKVVTLNVANWPYIGKLWNVTVEPLVIDILKDLSIFITNIYVGFIKGLKSDNKK
jgi:hypothetical protein